MPTNPESRRSRSLLAAVVVTAVLAGAGIGAGIYAAADGAKQTVTVSSPAPTQAHPTARTQSSQLSVGEIYARSAASVVDVTVTSRGSSTSPFPFGGGSQTQKAEGSGFVYDTKGDIVTNEHVVDGATSVSVRLADGSAYRAKVVGKDATTDLAVIRVNAPASALHPVTLGDSSAVAVGDGVVAIGSPFGLQGSVTSGIVSALHREIQAPNGAAIEDAIQTDAAINHGNSGGPLFDLRGDVIGVNAQISSDSSGNEGVGFAIPTSTVRSVVSQLLASGTAQHAFLGVDAVTVPAQAAGALGTSAGVAVASVQSGSAADRAGLEASTGTKSVSGGSYPTGGDVITAVDGTRITTAQQLRGAISAKKPGDVVELTVARGGKTRTLKVTLGSRSS
jgi:putative serine protease PepD